MNEENFAQRIVTAALSGTKGIMTKQQALDRKAADERRRAERDNLHPECQAYLENIEAENMKWAARAAEPAPKQGARDPPSDAPPWRDINGPVNPPAAPTFAPTPEIRAEAAKISKAKRPGELATLISDFDRLQGEMNRLAGKRLGQLHEDHLDEISETILAGRGPAEGFSQGELAAEKAAQISGYKRALLKLSARAYALLRPSLEKAIAAHSELVTVEIEAERQRHERFGFGSLFKPSPIIGAIRRSQELLEKRLTDGPPGSPIHPAVLAAEIFGE